MAVCFIPEPGCVSERMHLTTAMTLTFWSSLFGLLLLLPYDDLRILAGPPTLTTEAVEGV